MPASLLTEILFRGLVEIVLYGLGYVIGLVVVPVFSLGYYKVAPWDFQPRPRRKSPRLNPGPRVVSADTATGIGIVALVIASVLVYFLWRAASA